METDGTELGRAGRRWLPMLSQTHIATESWGLMYAKTVFPDAECFRHHECMQDWERLGRYVVARRTELGFRNRGEFATAVQVSARLISDIEKGRRTNFDQVTLSAVEAALGWETGSIQDVVDGGDPRLRPGAAGRASVQGQGAVGAVGSVSGSGQKDEIDLIYESNMPARRRLELIRKVLQLRAQAEAEDAGSGTDEDAQLRQSPSA
jgi:hypothetical protein